MLGSGGYIDTVKNMFSIKPKYSSKCYRILANRSLSQIVFKIWKTTHKRCFGSNRPNPHKPMGWISHSHKILKNKQGGDQRIKKIKNKNNHKSADYGRQVVLRGGRGAPAEKQEGWVGCDRLPMIQTFFSNNTLCQLLQPERDQFARIIFSSLTSCG